MLSTFYHLEHLYVSSDVDRLKMLQKLSSQNRSCILVVGPAFDEWGIKPEHEYTNSYLKHLLEDMVEWCIQEKVIQQQSFIYNLQALLQSNTFVPLAYKLEEFLTQQKYQCLSAVLHSCNQVNKIHYDVTSIPFYGYVTTSYDNCLEKAYHETHSRSLQKLYPSSLTQAIDNDKKEQPFILKLYGDLDNIASIKIGHRLLTGLHITDICRQLQQLFSEVPTIFIGFDEKDEDLSVLQDLVTHGYIIHQKQFTNITEPIESEKLIEISPRMSMLKTSKQGDIICAVDAPAPTDAPPKKTENRKTSSRSPKTRKNSAQDMQPAHKKLIDVCVFYAPKDEEYKNSMEEVLNELKNKKEKSFEIEYMSLALGESAGYKTDMKHPLMTKRLIILLISRSFIGSEHYNKDQMQKIVERHQQRAWISAVLVRPCNWKGTQFDSLENWILPPNKVPITSWKSIGKDEDEALLEISQAASSCACS